jgi:hypothetical protein
VADAPTISIRQLHKPELPPWIHQLRRPVTPESIGSLDPRCRIVQFQEALGPDELEVVSALLRAHPGVGLRVYGFGRGPYPTLDYLEHFPTVERVEIECYDLQDISGLRFLRADLKRLSLGQTKKRFSLAPVERFSRLERLWLFGHTREIEVLGQLKQLRHLSLRGITLPTLRLLTSLDQLEILELKLGGTRNLDDLPRIGRLRYFETFLVRGLSDLGPVAEIESLEYLFLQAQKQVTSLPSFKQARKLRRVHLQTMKGLRDLASLARAPAIETLVAFDMGHLTPEHFRPFVAHPTLREAAIGLGSKRKNDAVEALLGLPGPGGPPSWIDLS